MRSTRLVLVCTVAVVAAACSSNSTRPAASTSTAATTTTVPVAGAGTTTTTVAPPAAAAWSTYYRDAARDGASNDGPPSAKSIRPRWQSPQLDGEVYAQPLIVATRVYVATEHDSVYALDSGTGAIVWQQHLGEPVDGSALPCGNVDPVGITGTPVVDASTNRIFVVGMVQQPLRHMLFVLDTRTGKVLASTRVDAPGADPTVHNQRAALTLANGRVYVPFGGRFGDCGDYHGRLVSVRVTAAGIGAVASYLLPTQREGGWWAPPGAAVASDGSLYLTSGNSSSSGSFDYGNSVVRLDASMRLVDSFAPSNWKSLNAGDTDLGSSGPVLLPGNRVLQVGKDGIGYLLDAGHLGGIGGALHSADVCQGLGVWGAIAHDGDTVYVACGAGVVQVTVAGNGFKTGWSTSLATPGPTVVGNGVVWTVATRHGDLVALDARDGNELFHRHVDLVPSRFTSPALGAGMVVFAADRVVHAFGS